MRSRAVFILFALLPLPAAGLDPYLVKDINQAHEPGSSDPSAFATFGDAAFFMAREPVAGGEAWRSDGTAEGTWRLADIFSGDRSSIPLPFAVADRLVFFTAEEDHFGLRTLWVTDGTPGSAVRLTDGSVELGEKAVWVEPQGVLYFLATDDGHGEFRQELWRTDGTPAGTYQVVDGLHPLDLVLFQGRIWFVTQFDAGLWRSDGTPGGTVLVKDFGGSLAGTSLQVVGNRLVFPAPGPDGGVELWTSDGTARRTVSLTRLTRGRASPSFFDLQVIGSRLWFVADDGRRGQELWVTDGTPQGTRVLTSFAPKTPFIVGNGRHLLLPPTLTGGRLVFAADDGLHGAELWVSDGTARGTRLVRDVCPGVCPAVSELWRTHRGLLYWVGTNGVRGQELWVTDGTAAGTRLVRDVCRGSCSAGPANPFFLADRVLFTADDGSHGQELWSTDGTATGTVRVSDFGPALPWPFFQGTVAGGELLFGADDGVHGSELWRTDGTPAGTSLVRDINEFELGASYPEMLGALGSTAFFFAGDGEHGHELWKSDGTEAGTVLVLDATPGEQPFRRTASISEEAGGRLFFVLDSALWRTDGTVAGTFPVTGQGVSFCCARASLRALGDRVFFPAYDSTYGSELWVTDGTLEGTRRVADIRPGEPPAEPQDLTVFQGQIFFTAAGEDGFRELWRSDGTVAGTVRVAELGVFHSSAPSRLTVHADRLWLFGDDGEHGRELWSSDGTGAGTGLAVDLDPGPGSFFANLVVSLGAKLAVSGFPDGDSGGLWVTDGTPEGTERVGPVADGSLAFAVFQGQLFYNATLSGDPGSALYVSDCTAEGTEPLLGPGGAGFFAALDFARLGGLLLFSTDSGRALWATDGTPAGTFRVTQEGFEPFEFGRLLAAGPRVFFPGYSPETGVEPWAVEP